MSSTCFEPEGSSSGRRLYNAGIVCVRCISIKSSTYNTAYTDACKTLYHNCIYNRLPEDEPLGSKHVEDIEIRTLI